MAYVGQSVRRIEDEPLLRGEATFVDDLAIPGCLHLWVVRSPHAHARVAKVDAAPALAAPGVVAVLTGEDFAGTAEMPVNRAVEGMLVPAHHALERGEVHAMGTPVAAVIAETREQARDAADLVAVEYEPLPAVADVEAAVRPGAPLAHPELGSNESFRWRRTVGDVEGAFARATRVVAVRVDNARIAAMPLEGRGVVASYDPATGELTVWSSTQSQVRSRGPMAAALGIPDNRLRLIMPSLGGGFGAKACLYREDVLVAAAALRLGRPVRWASTRAEDFLTSQQARRQVDEAEAALDAEGRVLGLRVRILHDLGAYMQFNTAYVPLITANSLSGPYAIPAIEVEVVGVFTNTVATGPFRGAGKPEATLLLERLMDEAARQMGLDRVEVRQRNLIGADQFPYQAASSVRYDPGNYPALLDRALGLAGYGQLIEERDRRRAAGELVGVGLSTWVELSASGGWESANVRLEVDGRVSAYTGSIPMGQGIATCMAQIVADELGVPFEHVRIRHGDSAAGPVGMGSMGSRSIVIGGSAMVRAARQVREKVLQVASALLEVSPADLETAEGVVSVRGAPGRRLSFAHVAGVAYTLGNPPPALADLEPGLEASAFFRPSGPALGAGAHVALASVDPETGEVRLERFCGVDDCGRVINPMIVEGQLHGGLAQGIGQALWEQVTFDSNGQIQSGTLMDYAVPTATMLPGFELGLLETPSDLNPLGVKGVGEAGCVAAPPAVIGAVVDALSTRGVTHLDPPLTPEKVWQALRGASRAR